MLHTKHVKIHVCHFKIKPIIKITTHFNAERVLIIIYCLIINGRQILYVFEGISESKTDRSKMKQFR